MYIEQKTCEERKAADNGQSILYMRRNADLLVLGTQIADEVEKVHTSYFLLLNLDPKTLIDNERTAEYWKCANITASGLLV